MAFPWPCVAAFLSTAGGVGYDEASMLQMPVVNDALSSDFDTSECRCPGYYQEECEAEWAQGCVWSDAGESNAHWCQCLNPPVTTADPPVTPPPPPVTTGGPVTLPPPAATGGPVTLPPPVTTEGPPVTTEGPVTHSP